MTAQTPAMPPLALALGRLRNPHRPAPAPRPWPYNPKPAATGDTRPPQPPAAPLPQNDFLRILPEPALYGELPPPPPPERETLGAVEALALAPVNRTYWFDL